ncbi:hypothetical protein DFH06DRAFT_1344726 [Mycena polygramma]|nr:hypothetical protein DFH06DRAFT_1344726 [Mycena polygramma]
MPRGRQSPLPKDKLEFLESHFPEFLAKQPNLGRFWVDVVKEWFIRWPVEHRLGLEVISTHGVLIEDSGLSQEHQKLVGDAQEAEKNIIHNWFNNRSQKEKRALNSSGSSASNLKSLEKLLSSAQSRQTRKNHKVELWQKRHPDIMEAALQASNFDSLMPKAKAQETVEERRARIKVGRTAQMQLRRKTAAGLFAKASDEEKVSVEEEWLRQERPSKAAVMKASTPEEYQNGLDKIGPWLKTFHGVVGDALGWVGATVLTGPIPNQGGKIGTQSYCHGVTPAGHTIDQALPGWHEHVITPVQQFGKKVFDHDARRARAMKPADAAESHHDPVEPVTSAGQEPRRRKRRAKAKESAVDEADPFPPPSSAFTNIPVSSFNDVPSPPPSPPPASSFTDVPGGLDYSALQPFADFGDLNLNIDIDPETMRALEESSQEFMWETRALEGVDGLLGIFQNPAGTMLPVLLSAPRRGCNRLHGARVPPEVELRSEPFALQVVDYDGGSSSASMPQVTLEQLARHSHFFIAGMEAPPVPDTGFHTQHPNFSLKPNFDPTKRTVDWYPQQRDEARLPNTKVTAHEDLAGALFAHWVYCQVTHEHCLQANMLRRSEAEDQPEHATVATFDDEVEHMGMGWRADAFFANKGTMDSLVSAPSRAEFEAHPDADYY